eukprot:6380060-Ditylum_brightwellii.AAC.1
MTRGNVACTDCDTNACHDRAISKISALAQFQAGLLEHATTFFLKTLKQMKYHMVATHRIDEIPVSSMTQNSIYSLGQGATDAPQLDLDI